jgi:uncharacterized protein (TIGR03118 family)
MKTIIKNQGQFLTAAAWCLSTIILLNSCNKDDAPTGGTINQSYSQVNLVASTSTPYPGARVDANLINGWGMAFGPTGNAWVSAEGTGVSVIYDKTGAEMLAPVSIPSPTAATGGTPTGQVYNGSADFLLPNGNPAKFIFAGTDGVISGWNTGSAAIRMVDRSATSVYLGLALATNGANNYLYAADFKSGKIDVFDKNFIMVPMPFTDPGIPAGYSPFNIQNVGGQLYVMYAKVDPVTHEEMKGAGLGYVDIYNPDGSFVKRFVSGGELNAPWGIAQASSTGFVNGNSNAILIGNFGDGHINAYDAGGNFLGSLKSNGTTIAIDGLWGISFAPASATAVDPKWLFFTAGPSDENEGLFGYIK